MPIFHSEQIKDQFPTRPRRVVSLVPSLTESLFDLGAGDSVIGVTDYCERPEGAIDALPRVGGTRNPRVQDILELSPSLVLANQEENPKGVLFELSNSDIPVWLTFPTSIRESLDDLWLIAQVFQVPDAFIRLDTLEKAVEMSEADLADRTPVRYFCPIWRDQRHSEPSWWMTFNESTYAHDVLRLLGGRNIFSDRERRYPLSAEFDELQAEAPGDRDTRYPRVSPEEVFQADPEIILLPDEPFAFGGKDSDLVATGFGDTKAVKKSKVIVLEGSLIFWPGTRLGRTLQQLGGLFLF